MSEKNIPAALPEAETIDLKAIAADLETGVTDLVCVVGPTASGKTRYAVQLARNLGRLTGRSCEILSADSRQVYRGMDIGTGKDLGEYGEIPYHLIDIAPAGSRYSVYDYQRDFEAAYKNVTERGCLPILCGGSGLYVEAATAGYRFPEVPPDEALRATLEQEDIDSLRARLEAYGPVANPETLAQKRRIIRAIEVAQYASSHDLPTTGYMPKKPYFIGTLVSREERIARIDRRLDERLRGGLPQEVKSLLDSGIRSADLMYYGLEYKFVTQYVLGILDYGQMRTLLSNAIHQFAKRQMTWFRGMEKDGVRIHWVRP